MMVNGPLLAMVNASLRRHAQLSHGDEEPAAVRGVARKPFNFDENKMVSASLKNSTAFVAKLAKNARSRRTALSAASASVICNRASCRDAMHAVRRQEIRKSG